nr:HepT-like ribonuclease domain-containing protein [Leptospira gomenensis]
MKSDLSYINHIKEEIAFLQIESKKLDRDQFISDALMKRAFVRSIEIIGEASNKLSD